MPRDDRHDDRPKRRRPQEEQDYADHPPRKSNATVWIVLGLVAGLGVVAVVLFVGVFLFTARSATIAKPPAAVTTKLYTRAEFKAAVMGMTTADVKELLGVPVRTTDNGPGEDVYWYYRERTVDPVTGKTDLNAQLIFRNGVVVRVNH